MDAELRPLRRLPWLLLSFLALPAGNAGGQEVGVDRPGSDLRPGFVLDTPDPALCAEACELDTNCRAYTYVRPGYQGLQARCWLKGAVPNAVKNDCCISGVKFEGIARQLGSFSRDLTDIEAKLRALAATVLPSGSDDIQRSRMVAQRRELVTTANAVAELIRHVETQEAIARQKSLTSADMESLQIHLETFARQTEQRRASLWMCEPPQCDGKVEDSDLMDSDLMAVRARNEALMIEAQYQHWKTKADQLDSQLARILKLMKDLGRTGAAGSELGSS